MAHNDGIIPLHLAVQRGIIDVIKLFLGNSADPILTNRSLHYAVQYANRDVMQLPLDGGAKLNSRDRDGSTALHDLVQLLLTAGAEQ